MLECLFIFLFLEICFGKIILEPEIAIQSTLYYGSIEEELYHRKGDSNN